MIFRQITWTESSENLMMMQRYGRVWAILGMVIASCSGPSSAQLENVAESVEPTAKQTASRALTGSFLGQTPPTDRAEIFAPGLVSQKGRYEYALSFSPNGDEVLFSAMGANQKTTLMYARRADDRWTEVAPIQLTRGAKKEEMEAFFCPDGETIFFAPYDEGMDVRIWRVKKGPDGFGAAQQLQSPVNQAATFYPTCASGGALYYSNIVERKIYRAEEGDGTYASIEDTGLVGAGHCYIAPDEKYALIDSRREGGFGDSDIYLVRKNDDGSWAEPINLGPQVNTHFSETCPSLSPDGKYIFFSRYNEPNEVSDIYWISSDVMKRHLP